MESFDDDTRALINDIHYAWKSQASLSEYARLRDRIVAHRDKLDVQVSTLNTVVRLVIRRSPSCVEQGDMNWQDFFALAASLPPEKEGDTGEAAPKASRKRPQNWNEICRSRNLAIVVALWSTEIVQYYKWDRAGQGQIRVIRTCAVHFPDFEAAFVPRLNQVLLARHCAGILNCRERTLNEAKLQPLKDFEIEKLKSVEVNYHLQELWLTNQDGAIPLDLKGTLLKDVRPHHSRVYLLQKDKYGTLEPRGSLDPRPADVLVTPPSTSNDQLPNMLPEVGRLSPTDRLALSCSQRTPSGIYSNPESLVTASISPGDPSITDFTGLECPPNIDLSVVPQIFQNTFLDDDPTLLPNPSRSPSEIGTPWTPNSAIDFGCISPPSLIFQDHNTDPDSLWIQTLSQPVSLQCSPVATASLPPLDDIHRDPLLPEDVHASRAPNKRSRGAQKRQRISPLASPVLSYCDSAPNAHVIDNLNCASSATAQHSGSGLVDLGVMPFQTETNAGLRIEDQLHDKHSQDLRNHVCRLGAMGSPEQECIEARWLTPEIQWATVWSSSETLGRGLATCENEADILYCTADDVVTYAKTGKVFCKPIVIKESFTDSNMHTIAQTLALLQDFNHQSVPDFEAPVGNQSAPVRHDPWSASASDRSPGTISFRNMTKSHRPIFTMLTRFRLLETLTEGHQWDSQERTEPCQLGVRGCTGYNTVSLSGSFSGAQACTSYGTWTRNLAGTRYFMIVPEREMASEWADFANQGCKWAPAGETALDCLGKGRCVDDSSRFKARTRHVFCK